MREASELTSYDLIPTDNPEENVVLLWVPMNAWKRGTGTRTLGTTLADFLSGAVVNKDDALRNYSTYVLTGPGPTSPGLVSFYFAKPKATTTRTASDGSSAAWRTTEYLDDYEWPDVLRVLYALSGTKADGTDNVNQGWDRQRPLLIDRLELVKGARIPSVIRLEEFYSPVPFTDLEAERPLPMPVHWSLPNASISPNPQSVVALHGLIVFAETFREGQLISNWGTVDNIPSTYWKGQIFPPTNHQTWIEHTFKDEMTPVPVEGLYRRRRYTVIPPPMPPALEL